MIADNPQWWRAFLKECLDSGEDEEEAEALTTAKTTPLLAADKALDWVDTVLCRRAGKFIYGGSHRRGANVKPASTLLPGAIAEFNQYEFSRAMRHKDCINPLRVYSHIAPYGRAGKS